jgi:hypothetical protein
LALGDGAVTGVDDRERAVAQHPALGHRHRVDLLAEHRLDREAVQRVDVHGLIPPDAVARRRRCGRPWAGTVVAAVDWPPPGP